MRSIAITSVLVSLASGALTPTAAAQTTYLVGTGGFAQINDAIAVAAPGDVILVQPSSYPGFHSSIGVTIRGVGPGVQIQGPATLNLPAGHVAHLANFAVWSLAITGGSATVDHCTIGTMFGGGICTVQSSEVVLQACTVGSQPSFFFADSGLRAMDATITAIDSSFVGRRAEYETSTPATEGILLQDSTLFGSHLTAKGGDGYAFSIFFPTPAIRGMNSAIWVSDSSLQSGAQLQIGLRPCPVEAPQGRIARCSLIPSCTPAFPTGPLLGVHRPNPLQSPGPFTLDYRTEPNGLVAVYVATGLGNLTVAGMEQPILIDVATAFHLELLTADPTGFVSRTWNVPAGLTNQTFWFQAVGTASIWQLSPLAGGVVR